MPLEIICAQPFTGLPWWLSGKESSYQCKRCRRHGFSPWVGKIPWRRVWQPTPLFLPGDSWTEEPGGLQSMGSQSQTQLSAHASPSGDVDLAGFLGGGVHRGVTSSPHLQLWCRAVQWSPDFLSVQSMPA